MKRILYRHCILAGNCRVGLKLKCEQLGINFQDFVRNGASLEDARKIDDVQIQRVVKFVEGLPE